MNHDLITSKLKDKVVLFCVLNWGLGHASRMIPVIKLAKRTASKIIIASDGDALSLLKTTIQGVDFIELPAYNIRYTYGNMIWNAIVLLPGVWQAIRKEHRMVHKICASHRVDLIISDNRFGCWNEKVDSVFVTHQIELKLGSDFISALASKVNVRMIQRFKELWIADDQEMNLSGDLSKSDRINIPVYYTGLLSAQMPLEVKQNKYDVLVLLSGPEPKRSELENVLWDILKHSNPLLRVLFCSGKPQSTTNRVFDHIEYKSFLSGTPLNEALLQSEIIISRSGYSSLMDYAILGCKAILIPTEGQTEQEYLGRKMSLDRPDQFVCIEEVELTADSLFAAIKKLTTAGD